MATESPTDLHVVRRIMQGDIPPRVHRFVKLIGRAVGEYCMIPDGKTVLLGISGGKDSLALALGLALRRRWLPVSYQLEAVQIEWREYPLTDEEKSRLDAYFEILGIPYRRRLAQMQPPSFRGTFNCYLCSRNRKRILFDELSRIGAERVALGHHMDDIIETTLMNLVFHGSFSTMMPVQKFFGGAIELIRPMCRVPESIITSLSRSLGLPVVTIGCPHRNTNMRLEMKDLVSRMSHLTRNARRNIYRAPSNIVTDYLPVALHGGPISTTMDSEQGDS